MSTTTPLRLPPLAQRRAALESRHPTWVPRTLHGSLDEAARLWPDRPYVITDWADLTYTDIRDRSIRLAAGLIASGVRPGEHVAVVMANYPEFVAVKYAVSRVGAAAVPVNFLNRRDDLAHVLADSQAALLIVMDRHRDLDYLAMLDEIIPDWPRHGGGTRLPNLREVMVFDTDGTPLPPGTRSLAEVEAAAPAAMMMPIVGPESVADLIYTSGTTGGPKGVLLTHDMLLRTAYAAAYARGFEDGRRIHFALPMYHVFGYVEGMLPVTFVGGAIIPHIAFDPQAGLDAIENHRATDMLAIPLMTRAVLDAQLERVAAGHPAELSSLSSLLSSGTASPPGLWDRIDTELGCQEITTGYGMSETTASTTVTRPDDPPARRRGTNGRPRDAGAAGDPRLGGRLVVHRCVDPRTGLDVGRNAVGELQAFGPGITPGYWNKPEATAEAFTADGWLRTGDLGSIDDDEYVVLLGRAKDCYRCGGEQVVPKEAEDVLLAHPAVAQAHVVPVADPRMGEAGAAFVVARPGLEVSADELGVWAAQRLARFKVPRHFFLVEAGEIPLTASGRPRKFLLAQQAESLLQKGVSG
jgi:fatty-acyl-CoA synthase